MELFAKAEKHFEEKIPFVLYSKPSSDEIIGVFQQNDVLYKIEDFTEKGFAFVSFDGLQKVMIPFQNAEIIVAKKDNFTIKLRETLEHNFSDEVKISYQELVTKAISTINSGECSKIVTSRKEIVALKNKESINVFKKLTTTYTTAFTYCFYHPKVGLWLGATPEQLLKVEDVKVKTVALAGTKTLDKRNQDWGEKEQVEQQMVTNYIMNNLKPFVNDLIKTEPYTYQAGKLLHIKTDISAELRVKKQLGEVLKVLHPTPAVCGFPKDEAKQFILESEGYNREFYTGFLGELNFSSQNTTLENSDLFVNLRCMKLENNKAHVFVGGGITADSEPEKEFFETVNKSETIKKVL